MRVSLPINPSDTDVPTLLNIGEELVCVPVRITNFIPHTIYSRYLMSTRSLCVRSTSVIGKL